MAESNCCSQCGTGLPADAPDEGLCPKCLLKHGIGTVLLADSPSESAEPAAGAGFAPPSPGELAPLFPQLEVLELLGHGGMGAVYKARQPRLDRLMALKIIRSEAARDPAFAERFACEARALARLSHPSIVAIHDFGQAGGLYYFIMEYVDGPSLRQMERTGRLSAQEALAIVPQICAALQYAHDQGVVHRDIKPENILVDRQGRVKIADFGLAKLLGKALSEATLTATRMVLGTPHYMAPEQIERPAEVDQRADIYSLGVVFYEMLTGELPIGRFAPPSQKVEVDVRLDETGPLEVEGARLVYQAKLRSEGLDGTAYLEMWCRFPAMGEFFSRGLDRPLTSTTDWTAAETPFFLDAGQRPDNVNLNLVIKGKGTVWIDDIRLLRAPLAR